MIKRYPVRSYEAGLYFHNGEFRGVMAPGTDWWFDPLGRVRVEVVDQRQPLLAHEKLVPVLHYDGTPITARFIHNAIAERLGALTVKHLKKAIGGLTDAAE